jgi:hypothetical protein
MRRFGLETDEQKDDRIQRESHVFEAAVHGAHRSDAPAGRCLASIRHDRRQHARHMKLFSKGK